MAMALALGRRGQGRVWPWPSVGCVLVRNGRVVGRGRSDRDRMMHAEPVALEQAGELARGSTAYVTLEPCSHHGSTPPCAEALIRGGISRCVISMEDPNPLVDGGGIARLRAAGIDVDIGLAVNEATFDLAGFINNIKESRPFLTLKLAMSLDGRIATASGESKWITGPDARRDVHALRSRHDGVLVGAATARHDDPSLTVRDLGTTHQPVRIVASRHLDVPVSGKLARSARDVPVWILHGEGADKADWEKTGAQLIEVAVGADRQLDPVAMMNALASQGMTRVFCEGGGALSASLLSSGFVDQVIVYHAGLAIGAEGTPGVGSIGLGSLSEATRFELCDVKTLGPDVRTTWHPALS